MNWTLWSVCFKLKKNLSQSAFTVCDMLYDLSHSTHEHLPNLFQKRINIFTQIQGELSWECQFETRWEAPIRVRGAPVAGYPRHFRTWKQVILWYRTNKKDVKHDRAGFFNNLLTYDLWPMVGCSITWSLFVGARDPMLVFQKALDM